MLIVLLNLFPENNAYAYNYNSTKAWEIVSADKCTGLVKIRIWFYADELDDDYVKYHDLAYKNSSGNWVDIWSWKKGTVSGWEHESTNDDNFSYTCKNGAVVTREQSGSGDNYYNELTWLVPTDAIYGQNIELKIHNISVYVDDNTLDEASTKSIMYGKTGSPAQLQASSGTHCDKVVLSWTNPDIPCSVGFKQIEIYKDGSLLTTTTLNTFSADYFPDTYEDVFDDNGVVHNYKIRAKYTPLNTGISNYSDFTTVTKGSVKAPHSAPSSVSASKDNCKGVVDLSWQWNGENPENFQFQRSTSPDFSTNLFLSDEIFGDKRNYEDTPPEKNIPYYYRMHTKNVCGDWSTWSSHDEGFAPYAPVAPSNVNATASKTGITVSWTDNSISETGFVIERYLSGGGGNSVFTVGEDVTSFVDKEAANCQSYYYEVKSKNTCSDEGVPSGTPDNAKISPDLSNTFISSKQLKCSKGYFNNAVKLEWSNNNNTRIEYFKIYRKIYGSTSDSILITSENSSTAIYNDATVEPGVYYQYFIQAEANCAGNTIKSNISSDIGFKSPTGIVNGHIDYTGGIAVKDAKVLVTKTSGAQGTSLTFDGLNDYISVPHKTNLISENNITIEAWVSPSAIKPNNVLFSKGTSYEVLLDNKQPVFKLNNGSLNLKFAIDTFRLNDWRHIAVSYDGTTAKIYVNGELKASQAYSTSISLNTDSLFIGADAAKTNFFSGNIDEVRVWNTARTDFEIKRDYDRILNGNESGIAASWGFDENVGEFIFDRSKVVLSHNENHGFLKNGVSWSTVIPSTSQLGYMGITDENGDYTISGIRYALAGENFKLTPVLCTHEFTPSNRVIFIGTGSNIQNNQNFEDISAFDVSGNVRFAGTTCPVKDIILQIDGKPVIKNGQVVMTDADGNFTIKVPIGEHQVSVMRNGHEFSQGVFPPTGYWDFNDIVTGIQFVDTTLVSVVGRVVGGLEQEAKSPVLGRCKNNIGTTTIEFKTQNGCFSNLVTTADTSGQYIIQLPPMKYIVPDFSVTSNPVISFNNNDLLDLSIDRPLQTEVDTVFVSGTSIIKTIDSVSFHQQLDFIFREAPLIDVTHSDGKSPFIGDETFEYISTDKLDTTRFDLKGNNPFPFPVFNQNIVYKARIKAFEVYTNKDSGADNWVNDTVPITEGKITINNDLAYDSNTIIEMNGGDTLYSFMAGNPNVLINVNPLFDYTKVFKVQLETGTKTIDWKPLSVASGEYYRAYVLGSKSADGNSFVTNGPQVVDYILRDPPGSGSSTTLEKGSVSTWQESFSLGGVLEKNWTNKLKTGINFTSGVGFETNTEMTACVVGGWNVEVHLSESGEFVQTTTITETQQTNPNPELVGAQSDLFIGKSRNMEFGVANGINITADEIYNLPNVDEANTIVPYNGKNFSVARRKTLMIVPGGYETGFVYDRNHIENYLIPDLKYLRNQFFVLQPSAYKSKLAEGHENFGLNNDDPVWGTDATSEDPVATESADYNGQSYIFTKLTEESIDSVRVFNQQIRLWKEALRRDEEEKAKAIKKGNIEKNISINAGPTYSYSSSSSRSHMWTTELEINISHTTLTTVTAEVGGAGTDLEQGFTLGIESMGSIGGGEEHSTTFSYEINDPDIGDYFTVDVYRSKSGNSPMFYTRAGQTSCPHEEGFISQYYEPGTALSLPTLRREVPTILVNGASAAKLTNTPADKAAAFNLTLGNESESGDDMNYEIKILESTNPDGAVITMDGIPVYREVEVPGGSSVNKVLTVEKGPGDVYEYDSIAIVIQSPCDDEIMDTAYISAYFIPTCSDIEIINPNDKWVVNSSFNDTLNTIFADYDINFPGLEEIKFWYKPSSESSWVGIESWYKDTSGMNDPELKLIPENDIFTLNQWNLQEVNDGYYDIKASTICRLANKESDIFSGTIDRINPHPFGTPSPADGILSPNDDIMIQFNEPIDFGLLNSYNFSITGVLNGTELRHDGYLYFDGVDDYVEIADGLSLNGSFSMEFWLKRDNTGTETIISQGINANQSIQIGFNTGDKLEFKVAGIPVVSNASIDNKWHHIVCAYNKETHKSEIFIDESLDNSTTLLTDYTEGGKTFIGKSSVSNSAQKFKGSLHEFRIWNKSLDLATINDRMNTQLSGREHNLIGCWQMNEANGILTKDIARHRNGVLNGPTWVVDPSGRSQEFDGIEDDLEVNSGSIAFTDEMDFTIEFWFKAGAPSDTVTFLSNGRADRQGNNINSWLIFGTSDRHIRVMNDSIVFDAVTTDFFDNSWHHFALVINRIGNTYSYIDGELQKSTSSNMWLGFGGAKIWLGSKGWFMGTTQHNSSYFNGYIDEVRIWNLGRKQKQIARDRLYRLSGKEFGLTAYFPFEKYTESMGVFTLNETLLNIVDNSMITVNGNPEFSNDVPLVKLERPVQKIPYTYSVNDDKINFSTTIEPYRIENITMDITVKGVKDLQGNIMSSPKTWIAYVDKNQVLWQEQELSFSKKNSEALSFQTNILNTGGELKTFEIRNLPNWLTVDSENGTIDPNSYHTLNFEIDPAVNIGSYEEAISIKTDFGFNETLILKLNVFELSPNWEVDPDNFQYSMNVIGQLKINDVISIDTADIITAFVGEECRGVAKLEYLEAYDIYEVFLSIYSNTENGEAIKFKIWDASEGIIHININPNNYTFGYNTLYGSPDSPIMLSTNNSSMHETPLSEGWRWISFNLANSNLTDVNATLSCISAVKGDFIKKKDLYADYSDSIDQANPRKWDGHLGWNGRLTTELGGPGFDNKSMYMIKMTHKDTLIYSGAKLNPNNISIPLEKGWNWIGYTPSVNVEINDALGNYTPANGDLIKSQYEFALYDSLMGWLGDLQYLIPGQGYMLKTNNDTGTLVYPVTGMYRSTSAANKEKKDISVDQWKLEKESFQYNLSIVAELNLDDDYVNENHIIGAFVEDQCRGVAKPVSVNGKMLYFITIYGNVVNETISFKLANLSSNQFTDIEEQITFIPNDIYGDINEPFQLYLNPNSITNIDAVSGCGILVYPNPTQAEIFISLKGLENQLISELKISSVTGGIVYDSYFNGVENVDLSSFGKGIYFIIIKNSKGIYTEKIVVH